MRWDRPCMLQKGTHTPNPVLPLGNFVAMKGSFHLAGPVSSTPLQGKYKYLLLCHKGHGA